MIGPYMELWLWALMAASFLWIGLIVWVEGEWRNKVTRTLSLTALALTLYMVGEIMRYFIPPWTLVQRCLVWWWAGMSSVGWYAVAVFHTRAAFKKEQHRLHKRVLLFFCIMGLTLALLGTFVPSLFLLPLEAPAGFWEYKATPWYWMGALAIHMVLAGALGLFVRARHILHRGHGLLRWFVPATLSGMVGTGLIQSTLLPNTNGADRIAGTLSLPQSLGILALGIGCFFLVRAITCHHELLGRAIRTRGLVGRWLAMIALMVLLQLLLWSSGARSGFILLAPAIAAPVVAVMFDWALRYPYHRSLQLIHEMMRKVLGLGSSVNAEGYRQVAHTIFESLMEELGAEAGFLHIQAGLEERPFVLRYNWKGPEPTLQDGASYGDFRVLEMGGKPAGFVILVGPYKAAYSALEMYQATTYAYSITTLYLFSCHALQLEALAAYSAQERHEQEELVQQVVHDGITLPGRSRSAALVGSLSSIDTAADCLPVKETFLRREIREAVQEGLELCKILLKKNIPDIYPTLLHEGLLVALHQRRQSIIDVCPRVEIRMDTDGLNDAVLNIYLGSHLKRVLYSAIVEAIRNAVKYAGGQERRAITVWCGLHLTDEALVAKVRDNGVGFVPGTRGGYGTHMGLVTHQVAIGQIGGTMRVDSEPQGGTIVMIYLPKIRLRQDIASLTTQVGQQAIYTLSAVEWKQVITQVEQQPGGRYLINDDLSDLTRPRQVLELHHERIGGGVEVIRQRIALDLERQQHFHAQVVDYPYREIINLHRLQSYLLQGVRGDGSEMGIQLASKHVRHVIMLLQRFSHYELAFGQDLQGTNFAIKPGYAVLWELQAENDNGRIEGVYHGFCDPGPKVVAHYTRRFHRAWDAVPQTLREKRQVIALLEALLRNPTSLPQF